MSKGKLAGQTAWISGATKGIGEGAALLFAREGASVAVGKLMRSHRVVRSMIRLYGPGWIGRAATARELARSYLRTAAVVVLSGAGVLGPAAVVARNGVNLSRRSFDELQREVDAAKAAIVPGILSGGSDGSAPR